MSAGTMSAASIVAIRLPRGVRRFAYLSRQPPAIIGLSAFLLYGATSLARFDQMKAGIDLAIFTEAVKQYSNGNFPWSYLKGAWGFNLLGDHFSPVVALIAPLYRQFPDARTLLIVQSALVALTASILTRSTERLMGSRMGLGVGIAFTLAWGVQSMALFDFHEIAFALPLLAMALSELLQHRESKAIAWSLPLMLVKEDSVFLLLGIVLVLAVRRNWRSALGLTSYALVTFATIVGLVIPRIGYYGRYTYWSSTGLPGALDALWASVSSGKALSLLLALALPSLGLALRSPLALVALPPLMSRLTSANEHYWSMGFHYNATVTLVLAFAAVDAVLKLVERGPGYAIWVTRGVLVSAIFALIASSWLPLGVVFREAAQPCPRCAATKAALAAVPDGASVAADDTLVSYLVDRTYVHELKPDLRDTNGRPIYPEYIAMDRSGDAIWNAVESTDGWREQLLRHHAYGQTYDFVCERVRADSRSKGRRPVYDIAILRTSYPSSAR